MMKRKFLACIAALWAVFYCLNAHAQYVPNHAVPLGTGAGSLGFNSVGPCANGVPIVGTGVTSDPSCSSTLASPVFTGAPVAPTPGSNISTTQIPTTAWVNTWYAPLASPAFTGTPTSTTPAVNDNSTNIATTAFVANGFLPKTGALPCAVTTQVSKSANYGVVSADSGTLFNVTGRSTITFPGPYSQGFCITLYNGDTAKAQKVTVNGSTYFLWPNQTEQVYAVSGGALVYTGPNRWRAQNMTFFVGTSPNCNNANDGLTADASGQICSINTTIQLIQTYLDSLGTNPTIKLGDGIYNEAVNYAGFGPYAKDGIVVNGSNVSPANVTVNAPAGNPAFFCRDYCVLFVQKLTIQCNNASSSGISSSQFSTVDVQSVILGPCDNNNAFFAWSHGHVDFNTGVTISGNSGNLLTAQEAGEVTIGNQQLTCTGNPIATYFANVGHLAHINAVGLTFSGCAGVTGTRYNAAYNGTINTNGGGAGFFPGTLAGATSAGGQYQ